MKISTAMALGRTMIRSLAGQHLTYDQSSGCAWGMVNVAAPTAYQEMFERTRMLEVKPPCECTGLVVGGGMRLISDCEIEFFGNAIVHLFNDHVMTKKDWTMDQLIDWVASVEPPDPEEEVIRKEIHEEILACHEHVEHR